MSTQRREDHFHPSDEDLSLGLPDRLRRKDCTVMRGSASKSAPAALQFRVAASVGAAPPEISEYFHPSDKESRRGGLGTPDGLATNSLQSDHRIGPLVRPENRRGLPPSGAGRRMATGRSATFRSSLPHIPSPPGPAGSHPALP
jgi:hypothetical protein